MWSSSGSGVNVTFYGGSDVKQVALAAAAADLAIVFVGTTSKEGTDRASLSFPADQDAAITAAAKAAPHKTVVCIWLDTA